MRELDNRLMKHIDLLVERYPSLESARNDIVAAYLLLEESYKNGGKLLVAGNGGSAADAEHIVGELMKGFKLPRKYKIMQYTEYIKNICPGSKQCDLPRRNKESQNTKYETN